MDWGKFFLYSTECELRKKATPAPGRGEGKYKTYMYYSPNMGEESTAQLEVPKEYERIKRTKVYTVDYPPCIPEVPGYQQLVPEEKVSKLYAGCERCQLCNYREKLVFWRGTSGAKLVFLGMAPGFEEDKSGLPFVGLAGRTQNMMLEDAGFDLQAVFLNLVCCRTMDGTGAPKREDPTIEEMVACSQRLWLVMNSIKPHIVIALGRLAATAFWDEPKKYERNVPYELIPNKLMVLQTFHPSYVQRKMREGEMFEYTQMVTFYRGLARIIKGKTFTAYEKGEPWVLQGLVKKYPFRFIETAWEKKWKR